LVIGHVGSFWKIKNQTFLIDIFQELHKQNPQSKLILVGEGELKNDMIQKVQSLHLENAISFLGSRSDVPDLLKAFDVFVFPSLGEGLSVAMLEAQCAGLPCVVSNTIPKEVEMTDLITYLPLNNQPKTWCEQILKVSQKKNNRNQYPAILTEKGYDIRKNAEWLQNYYLEQWQKH
jgi:glycosyltransferase involved in cell wall biosynthesis